MAFNDVFDSSLVDYSKDLENKDREYKVRLTEKWNLLQMIIHNSGCSKDEYFEELHDQIDEENGSYYTELIEEYKNKTKFYPIQKNLQELSNFIYYLLCTDENRSSWGDSLEIYCKWTCGRTDYDNDMNWLPTGGVLVVDRDMYCPYDAFEFKKANYYVNGDFERDSPRVMENWADERITSGEYLFSRKSTLIKAVRYAYNCHDFSGWGTMLDLKTGKNIEW